MLRQGGGCNQGGGGGGGGGKDNHPKGMKRVNNEYGAKGKLKCQKCRDMKQKCILLPGEAHCERCKKTGNECRGQEYTSRRRNIMSQRDSVLIPPRLGERQQRGSLGSPFLHNRQSRPIMETRQLQQQATPTRPRQQIRLSDLAQGIEIQSPELDAFQVHTLAGQRLEGLRQSHLRPPTPPLQRRSIPLQDQSQQAQMRSYFGGSIMQDAPTASTSMSNPPSTAPFTPLPAITGQRYLTPATQSPFDRQYPQTVSQNRTNVGTIQIHTASHSQPTTPNTPTNHSIDPNLRHPDQQVNRPDFRERGNLVWLQSLTPRTAYDAHASLHPRWHANMVAGNPNAPGNVGPSVQNLLQDSDEENGERKGGGDGEDDDDDLYGESL